MPISVAPEIKKPHCFYVPKDGAQTPGIEGGSILEFRSVGRKRQGCLLGGCEKGLFLGEGKPRWGKNKRYMLYSWVLSSSWGRVKRKLLRGWWKKKGPFCSKV